MSAVYLLGAIALWGVLTWGFARLWAKFGSGKDKTRRRGIDVVFEVAALVWLGGSFWYAGGRNIYYDAKLNRLCAADGGIKIHETMRLPADKFDAQGQPTLRILPKSEAKRDDGYYYERDILYYKKDHPELSRWHFKVIRRADEKLLGESTYYDRGKDILPSFSHDSFRCPPDADISALKKQIFVR
jgi:hypothetical protein